MATIESIESRFKEVTGLTHLDLSIPHFQKGDNQQQATTKEEYKKFGFVTTPLWLVDEMLEPEIPNLTLTSTTCDACAGCGQFSIRLMRKLHDKFINMGIIEEKVNAWITSVWLPKLHYFTEFQFSNVAKLIYIFGTSINVYVGDSLNMKYAGDNDSGLLFFNAKEKKWVNLPNLMSYILPMKDDLNALLLVFDALEKKIGNCK
jgi:hypothetical protein